MFSIIKKNKLVSVIIPTYNRARFIERAVHSVLRQTYRDLEVITVDDGSKDDTLSLIAELAKTDQRVRYILHEKNRGAQAARNTGIKAAEGNYIAFLDSDDEWLPDKLERQMTLFENSGSKVGVVYAGFQWKFFDERPSREQKPRFRGDIYQDALREWVADTNTLVIRKDILRRCGLCNERIRAYQEWDICIRLARYTEFDFVAEPLAIYHVHKGLTISKDMLLDAYGYLDVITEHRDEIMNELGHRVLSIRLVSAAKRFARISDFKTARMLISEAIKLWPIKGNGMAITNWLLYHFSPTVYKIVFSFIRRIRELLYSAANISEYLANGRLKHPSVAAANHICKIPIKNQNRIAIIFPFPFLDSVPSITNCALLLAKAGFLVDLFLFTDHRFNSPSFDHPNINVIAPINNNFAIIFHGLQRIAGFHFPLWGWFWYLHMIAVNRKIGYRALIGVDPQGLIAANIAANKLNIPLIYFSLELMMADELIKRRDKWIKKFEKAISQRTEAVIVQDRSRSSLLQRENQIDPNKIHLVPNAPMGPILWERFNYWHRKFNLDYKCKIILYSGSITRWACIQELIKSSLDWPEEWRLVIHSRVKISRANLLAGLFNIFRDIHFRTTINKDKLLSGHFNVCTDSHKVLFSTDPVPSEQYTDIIQSADVGIAFYRPQNDSIFLQQNLINIGLSSGKLAYYLMAGVPVLVSDLPDLTRLVETYGCGEVITDPTHTVDGINKIFSDYYRYRHGAVSCFQKKFDFEKQFSTILDLLK
jgi:glycosyltransferase involved in cell wall biosynthesis